MIIAIDGDTLIYRACFAAQRTHYVVWDIEGDVIKEFPYKRDMLDWLEEQEAPEDHYNWNSEVRVEPVENALHLVKTMLSKIMDTMENRYPEKTLTYKIYLSGANNFRKYIGHYTDYKGNRKKADKPQHLQSCRQYLEEEWDSICEENVEADDLMAIDSSTEGYENVVLVTTDKDLNQVPGCHYNFYKGEFSNISPEKADHFFWLQMLAGDTADNIEGVRGVGVRRGHGILKGLQKNDELREKVYSQYTARYGTEEGHERFLETYKLLRLLRSQESVEMMQQQVRELVND